jgi:hypothetical protein
VTAGAEWHLAHKWSLMTRFDGGFAIGRELREDRHAKQMMPGIGNNKNVAV